MSKGKFKIDSVDIKEADILAARAGRDIVFNFDKYFSNADTNLTLFRIGKQAYYNPKNAKHICQYINVFNKYYDTDKEYVTAMINLKYQIDSKSMAYGLDIFINDVIEYLLSDTMIAKIWQVVNDHYMIDLEQSDEKIKEDAQVLQFDNCHAKILMAVSMACKLTIPLVCHYFMTHGADLAKAAHARNERELSEKEYFYKVFCSYLPLFQGDVNIFNKLVATATMHVARTVQYDGPMWERARNRNLTPTIQITRVMISVMIDLVPKYEFDGNPITLNHVSINNNIENSAIVCKDKNEYFDVSIKSSNDELSGLEKLEANAAKVSDLDIILAKLNISETVKKLAKTYNVSFKDDEIKFYKNNMKNLYFSELILQFFAESMGGYYDLNSIDKIHFIKLVIIMKKILGQMGFRYLQHLLTGNIPSKIKKRRITSKQLERIQNSVRYKRVLAQYSMSTSPNNQDGNPILKDIAILINTPITLVDYTMRDKLGEEIIIDADIVSDEYLRFNEHI